MGCPRTPSLWPALPTMGDVGVSRQGTQPPVFSDHRNPSGQFLRLFWEARPLPRKKNHGCAAYMHLSPCVSGATFRPRQTSVLSTVQAPTSRMGRVQQRQSSASPPHTRPLSQGPPRLGEGTSVLSARVLLDSSLAARPHRRHGCGLRLSWVTPWPPE